MNLHMILHLFCIHHFVVRSIFNNTDLRPSQPQPLLPRTSFLQICCFSSTERVRRCYYAFPLPLLVIGANFNLVWPEIQYCCRCPWCWVRSSSVFLFECNIFVCTPFLALTNLFCTGPSLSDKNSKHLHFRYSQG